MSKSTKQAKPPAVENAYSMFLAMFCRLTDSGKYSLAAVLVFAVVLAFRLNSADLKELIQQMIHEWWFIIGGWVVAIIVWMFHSTAIGKLHSAHTAELERVRSLGVRGQKELDFEVPN